MLGRPPSHADAAAAAFRLWRILYPASRHALGMMIVVIRSMTRVLFTNFAAGVAIADSERRPDRGIGRPSRPSPTQAADAMGTPASSRGSSSSAADAATEGPPGRPSAVADAARGASSTVPVSGGAGPSAGQDAGSSRGGWDTRAL